MLLEVGIVARAHGLKGQVVVELTTNRSERLDTGSVLDSVHGALEVTAASQVPSGAGRQRWIVSFAGVGTRDAAERLRGAVLRAEPLDDPDTLWVHVLIGARVYDTAGTAHGSVIAVQSNPASDLLVLDDGTLVPLRFVVDQRESRLTVDAPPGLLDG